MANGIVVNGLVRVVGDGVADFEVNPTGFAFVLSRFHEMRDKGAVNATVMVSEDRNHEGSVLVQILLDYMPKLWILASENSISFGRAYHSLKPLDNPPEGFLVLETVAVGWGEDRKMATLAVTVDPFLALVGGSKDQGDGGELMLADVGIRVIPQGETPTADDPYIANLYIKVPERLESAWKEKAYERTDEALEG